MAYRPSGLFRTRNILGVVLIAGILVGINLPDFLRFGTGGSGFFGIGRSGDGSSGDAKKLDKAQDQDEVPGLSSKDDKTLAQGPSHELAASKVVKVLIDEHQFLLRDGKQDKPITLAKLLGLIKAAPGDDDGVRVRIYQTENARMSTQEELKRTLDEAKIPDTAVFWVPSTTSK